VLERPDRPLADFGAALRRARARHRLIRRGAIVLAGCAALVATMVMPPRPLLVWNASQSMPIGLYGVAEARMLVVGDLAVARLPGNVGVLAARRRYLPRDIPLIKDVAAARGQRVCAEDVAVAIDGAIAALRRRSDRRGRPLPWWQGCRWLGKGEVLLLGRSPDSFDGRYFGPTPSEELVGRAVPLWLR